MIRIHPLVVGIVVGLAVALHGCSSRMHGTASDLPAQPALGPPIERIGRALTGNALIGPIDPGDASALRKEVYNRAAPPAWPQFTPDFERTLGLYDSFDGTCGNQWLADRDPAGRYRALATLFADDRLWIDSHVTTCTQYLAVERAALGTAALRDCGGRTPPEDAVDVFRSLLILGATTGVEDGIAADDHAASTTTFPFLAAP